MPGPVSATTSAPGRTETTTEPAGGVSRSAFSTRFEATWSRRSWSASTHCSVTLLAELDAELLRRRLVPRDGLAGDVEQVDRLAAHRELAAVHPGQIEQVVDEPLEPSRLDERSSGRPRRARRLPRASPSA